MTLFFIAVLGWHTAYGWWERYTTLIDKLWRDNLRYVLSEEEIAEQEKRKDK